MRKTVGVALCAALIVGSAPPAAAQAVVEAAVAAPLAPRGLGAAVVSPAGAGLTALAPLSLSLGAPASVSVSGLLPSRSAAPASAPALAAARGPRPLAPSARGPLLPAAGPGAFVSDPKTPRPEDAAASADDTAADAGRPQAPALDSLKSVAAPGAEGEADQARLMDQAGKYEFPSDAVLAERRERRPLRFFRSPDAAVQPQGVSIEAAVLSKYPGPSPRTFERWRRYLGGVLSLRYKVSASGLENVPRDSGALLVVNHLSYLDVLLLCLVVGRPVRFLMNEKLYNSWMLHWFAKKFGAIPIAYRSAGGSKEDTEHKLRAAQEAVRRGELVAIFSEGVRSFHGMLSEFRRGIEYVAQDLGAPVIPVYIDGLWGSLFSRKPGVLKRWRPGTRTVRFAFGEALRKVTVQTAYDAMMQLGARAFRDRLLERKKTLAHAFVDSAKANFTARLAVTDGKGGLTYGALLATVLLLARAVKPALGPGRNVGVLLPPSSSAAVANLATAALGRAAVNLPEPADRAAFERSLEVSGAEKVLTTRESAARFSFLDRADPRLVFLEDYRPSLARRVLWEAALRLLPRSAISRLFLADADGDLGRAAAVLFTGGTSGPAAPVVLTHLNLQAAIEMLREVFPLSRYRVVLGALTFSGFFGLAGALWLPLLLGKSVVYHPDAQDAPGVAEKVRRYKADLLPSTPQALDVYRASVDPRDFRSLGLVIASGEAMPMASVTAFQERFGKKVLRAYGAAELSLLSVNVPYEDKGNRTEEKKYVRNRPDTVGHFMPGTAVRVVDPRTFEPLPFGQPGLLLTMGANVAPGYLNDGARTQRSFRDGWFVTGDIAILDKDGYLTILGRAP